jgi:hypothetical protein
MILFIYAQRFAQVAWAVTEIFLIRGIVFQIFRLIMSHSTAAHDVYTSDRFKRSNKNRTPKPYAAFQVCIRRGWSRLPHINQIYGEKNREAIASAVKTDWAGHISSRFTISILPQYRDEAYGGLEAQIDHRNWVMDQIKARHDSPHSIGRACYVHGVLPEDDARLKYGQAKLNEAKAEIAFDGLVPDEPSVAELALPSCFGLPGALDAGGGKCDECPAFRLCLRVETAVRKAIAKKLGSEDPVLGRHKAQGRKRSAKFRAKKARQA